jgi:CheY-like chemotaxis protein
MVSSATAALERLATNDPYDVVLCDLLLPGMTGIEFHRVVAGQYPEYAPRFVFVTAATHVPEAERYLASVPNERLGKPFRVSDVRSVVQRVSSMLG